jgi:hypothetical protein
MKRRFLITIASAILMEALARQVAAGLMLVIAVLAILHVHQGNQILEPGLQIPCHFPM